MIELQKKPRLSLSYDYGGLFVTDEAWSHPARTNETYELIYVVAGDVHLLDGDTPVSFSAGDAYLLRPGVPHRGFRESHGHSSFYWAHFHTSDFPGLQIAPGLSRPRDGFRLMAAFRQLLHIGNTPGYPPWAGDTALSLLLLELAAAQRSSAVHSAGLVFDIAEWIRINSEKKLTVETVSRHFGYHPDYLCTLFKKSLGLQLKQYINRERLTFAKHLLLSTHLSVKEIAAQLSYENENQFTHFFKYHEGLPPARYRNLYYHTHMNKE